MMIIRPAGPDGSAEPVAVTVPSRRMDAASARQRLVANAPIRRPAAAWANGERAQKTAVVRARTIPSGAPDISEGSGRAGRPRRSAELGLQPLHLFDRLVLTATLVVVVGPDADVLGAGPVVVGGEDRGRRA